MMKYSKMSIRYGVRIALALIAYFLLMRVSGLLEVYWLRLLNGVIMGYGIYKVVQACKIESQEYFSSFEAFAAGIRSGVLATFIFVVFVFVYMFLIDPAFSSKMMQIVGWETTNPIRMILIVILIEGIGSSVVLSLTFIQLFKTSNNILENT